VKALTDLSLSKRLLLAAAIAAMISVGYSLAAGHGEALAWKSASVCVGAGLGWLLDLLLSQQGGELKDQSTPEGVLGVHVRRGLIYGAAILGVSLGV